ncbi:MAG: ComEC family competence protein [Bacteroidia bacterium]|nr:ComEC family competence protein [Bacteroidia bacterium]
MPSYVIHFWKKNPFIRLLIPLMAGIAIQWHVQINERILLLLLLVAAAAVTAFFFIPLFKRYSFGFLTGIATCILFFCFGALLLWYKDIRNNDKWFGNFYHEKDALIVSLDEPLVEKTKSYKANATVSYLIDNKVKIAAKGKIILYFKKDSLLPQLDYGSQIIFKKSLQEIKNSGNPGGFDYKRYSLFHGITHQVYLKPGEFSILKEKKEKWLNKFLFNTREKVLDILRRNIKRDKERGLAEALLIGYKNDLDQALVQSYTNTGVVHIIAISGLHLGLIYWLLLQLFKPLKKRKNLKWLRPILIIAGLWLFSLLVGAQASVLRSAVMFTCIIFGASFNKKASIYNTIALSAFFLLCYNPYWLWDVGFQLSYAAVLSIIIFVRPIYNWFYFPNKLIDFIWKLNSVTLAAQILTVPLSIYHFHQFPNYFILTNFVAVPLASLILLSEIFLCIFSFIAPVAMLTGKLLTWLIGLMNTHIERIEGLPFSLWDGLLINTWQAILLIVFVSCSGYWLLEKSKTGLKIGLAALAGFVILRSYSFIQTERQQKIIVYNVPQHSAIDFVNGRNFLFVGDSDLVEEGFARNFHLKPSRILYRINETYTLNAFCGYKNYNKYLDKNILLLDKSISFQQRAEKSTIDLLVISKNPKVYITKLANAFNIKQVVFDGSVPAWKLNYWKKDCDSLHIPYHDVNEKGAFVMNLN